jgi:aspartate aminotransferase-like enzyme
MRTVNLRISGPTPLPDAVRAAMRRDMMSHRSSEFREIVRDVVRRLAHVFGEPATVLPFTCSGTGGLEAAIVNTLRPGQRVIVVSIGYFGQRLADIARAFGTSVDVMSVPWGQAADPGDLRALLRRSRDVAALLMTHNETSTGVVNPLEQLCAVAHNESDALVIVDVVSSLGACPVRMRDSGIDVAVGVTQKALMTPPGLALLGPSERALAVARANNGQRYYFDFTRMSRAVTDGTTTYTPAIAVFYGLQAALHLIDTEGFDRVISRHRDLAEQCRNGVVGLGLELAADPLHASRTVTAIRLPRGVSASVVRARLAREHRVLVSSGRGEWKERVLRIGHMGYVSADDVSGVIHALGTVLSNQAVRRVG